VVRDICATRLPPLAVEIAAAPRGARPAVDARPAPGQHRRIGAGPRDAARQQTLTDTVRWSTISSPIRGARARFSVFVGGCDLTAAEAVAQQTSTPSLRSSNGAFAAGGTGRRRFGMLDDPPPASELLHELGEHGGAGSPRTTTCASQEVATPAGVPARDARAARPEIDNLRAVYDRAATSGDHSTALKVATALYPYWYVRGLYREGRDRIAAVLASGATDSHLHARALRCLAGLHYLLGEDTSAETAAVRGIEVGTLAGALEQVMACHTVRGLLAERHEQLQDAAASWPAPRSPRRSAAPRSDGRRAQPRRHRAQRRRPR
jgi:hypothetical protein